MKGGSIEYLKEKDPGSMPSSLICADCNAPWGNLPKCLCKGTTTIDLSSTPMSVIEVDGQVWQLRSSNSGPAWVLSDSKGTKEAGYIEVGYLNKTPLRQQPLALTRRWSASQNRCLTFRESLSGSRSRTLAKTGSLILRVRGHQPWRNKTRTNRRSSSTPQGHQGGPVQSKPALDWSQGARCWDPGGETPAISSTAVRFWLPVFLARTPTKILDPAEQAVQDSQEQMRFRAACDERITLPLGAQAPAKRLQQALCPFGVTVRCGGPGGMALQLRTLVGCLGPAWRGPTLLRALGLQPDGGGEVPPECRELWGGQGTTWHWSVPGWPSSISAPFVARSLKHYMATSMHMPWSWLIPSWSREAGLFSEPAWASSPTTKATSLRSCTKRPNMPTSAFLMQLTVMLHKAGVQLAPSHMKRDYNQWADELAHPNFAGFRPDRQLPVSEAFSQFKFLWPLLGNQPSGLNSKRRRTDPKAT